MINGEEWQFGRLGQRATENGIEWQCLYEQRR